MDIRTYPHISKKNLNRIKNNFKAEGLHHFFFDLLNSAYNEIFDALDKDKRLSFNSRSLSPQIIKVKGITVAAKEARSLELMYNHFLDGAQNNEYADNNTIYELAYNARKHNVNALLKIAKDINNKPVQSRLNDLYKFITEEVAIAREKFIEAIEGFDIETHIINESGDFSTGAHQIGFDTVADDGALYRVNVGKKNTKKTKDFKTFNANEKRVKKNRENRRKKELKKAIAFDHDPSNFDLLPGGGAALFVLLTFALMAIIGVVNISSFGILMTLPLVIIYFLHELGRKVNFLIITHMGYTKGKYFIFINGAIFIFTSIYFSFVLMDYFSKSSFQLTSFF